ncbi:hypothetical protein [Hymenobacter koreensis]|uniref:Uncharacterized protein n=1 Tax=Hymenobacter koreensis TaxID=1084523 RepID=A0ABP8J856_9BACT
MKALFIAAVCCGLGLSAHGQMRDRQVPNPSRVSAAQAEELTRKMAVRLHLNEAQIIKLRSVNEIKLARLDEIQWQYEQDPTGRQARIMELEAQYEQECRLILTPSQLSALREEKPAMEAPQSADPNQNGMG